MAGGRLLVAWAGLSTSSIEVGIACANTSTTCAPGATLHEAWTAIYRSIVTIDDPTPPTASGASGSLFSGGYLRGNATATLGSAADGSGIKAVQVRVDGGRVVGEAALACDYTRSRPCSDVATPTTVPVVTSNIGDGTHVVQVGAVDAGDNFTAASTQTITVDNEPPAPPAPTSPVFATVASERSTISWAEPAGQVSPITQAHVTVCKATSCSTSTQPAGFGPGQATVALPDGPGAYAVSVSLSDGAGNHDPYRAAHWSITLAGPASSTTTRPIPIPTTPSPTPRLRLATPVVAKDRRTIRVRGTATTNGNVRLTLKARINGRVRTTRKQATVTSRRYSATLRLSSRRWRTATLTARHAGTTITKTIRNR